jgi:predicted transcriptional regulator
MAMASAPTSTTEELVAVTVSLPADVLREIDRVAAEMGLTRSELFTGAARRLLFGEQRWREAQALFAEAAREAGFRTEDDVEDYLDSLPDPQR